MTQETADVQRLDYSKPPPGYTSWSYRGASVSGTLYQAADGEQVGPLKAAWARYKASNDPPGMWSGQARGEHPGGYGYALMESSHEHPLEADFERIDEARAAAWAWYDRRLALTDRLDRPADPRRHGVDPHLIEHHPEVSTARLCKGWWPRCLTWSDTQVAEVERWLVDSTAEMPEVLRG